jgi:hypothetical protein
MKKYIGIITIVTFLAACGGNDKKAAENMNEQAKPLVSRNTETFNHSFSTILTSYDALKSALTDYDTTAANTAAGQLATATDSLKLQEIKGDSTGAIKETAASYTATISSAAKMLITETGLEKKKRQFQSISDALYDLIRTVKYDQQKIYRQHCPMAFNDEEEAYWISISNEVINPYLGKKHPKYKASMLSCGDVADSLDFRKK